MVKKEPLADDSWRKVRGKKDRRRWCGGHPGREHEPVIVVSNYLARPGFGVCRFPQWAPQRWWCRHRRQCSRCGRILEWALGAGDCPDYPGTDQAPPALRL